MNKLYKDLYLQAEKEGYETTEKMCNKIYKLQKQDQEELLNKIGRTILDNVIEDNKLKINDTAKKILTKDFTNFIRDIAKKQYKNEKLIIEDILSIVTKDKYNKNSYITNLGIDYTIQKLTDSQIDKIVNEEIAGEIWSNRIWKNKTKLERQLQKEVSKFLKGNTNINNIKKQIQTQFNQNAYNTKRLVETEVCRCQSSVNDVFAKEHGIGKQMFMATLDKRTSNTCKNYDGQEFNIDDTKKPVPPLHPMCRSVLINIPSDNWKPKVRKDNITKEYVPFITYDEWAKQQDI